MRGISALGSVRGGLLGTAAIVVIALSGAAHAQKVAVITPYLAQPGTQFYVEGFQAAAKDKGWEVNVIDTKNDVAAVISRIEDVVNQKVDAIVINVDPAQVAAGLQAAKAAPTTRRPMTDLIIDTATRAWDPEAGSG